MLVKLVSSNLSTFLCILPWSVGFILAPHVMAKVEKCEDFSRLIFFGILPWNMGSNPPPPPPPLMAKVEKCEDFARLI
jgi:hypothetical protein